MTGIPVLAGLDSIREIFAGEDVGLVVGGIVVVAAFLVAVGILLNGRFSRVARGDRRDRGLFRAFARGAGLTLEEEEILYRVARQAHLAAPLHIFVRRSVYEVASSELGVNVRVADSIRRKLFQS
jgi:hypothetical protein